MLVVILIKDILINFWFSSAKFCEYVIGHLAFFFGGPIYLFNILTIIDFWILHLNFNRRINIALFS